MSSLSELLRRIPKVDELLIKIGPGLPGGVTNSEATAAVREVLDQIRSAILSGQLDAAPSEESFVGLALKQVADNRKLSLKRVVNATGIVLHTNFGRAPLAQSAIKAVQNAAQSYTNLEYDIAAGERGSRHRHVEKLLCRLTGGQSAMVLNNNAAAVLVMLSAVAGQKETIISRGELVEIGGAFRMPDVMAMSGSILREVGTTNKSHLSDYENAVDLTRTGALLKVHTSNFKIIGFTEEVELPALLALGRKNKIPVLYDLGSGYLTPLDIPCLANEPTVKQSLQWGTDLVCFSGDKLLGGPQAGIVVGKGEIIEKMKAHPLARCMRIDKMTLAALEATLRLYLDPAVAKREIPTLRMLDEKPERILAKAEQLKALLQAGDALLDLRVIDSQGQVGGGSAPSEALASTALSIAPHGLTVVEFEKRLRELDLPIIGRIFKDRLLLDMLTVDEDDLAYAAQALMAIAHSRI